ncbi:hypothetical protein ABMX64_23300 [Vibrio vulnificus]|uniref:hypothetical protein n=1 Tax=Vibrio vulnificus TaxID=672 RepID=UPI0021DADE16
MVLSDLDGCYWVICLDENTHLASYAMPNQWFTDLGLVNLEHVKTGYVFSNYAEWKCA